MTIVTVEFALAISLPVTDAVSAEKVPALISNAVLLVELTCRLQFDRVADALLSCMKTAWLADAFIASTQYGELLACE